MNKFSTTSTIALPLPPPSLARQIGLIIILSFSVFSFLNAQIIWSEDFETHGNSANGGSGAYSSPNDFYDTASDDDYWGRVEGGTEEYFLTGTSSGLIANSIVAYTGYNGSFFYAGEDLDDVGAATGNPDGLDIKEIDVTGINISNATALTFKGLFAAGENDPCGSSAYDDDDFIEVFYQVDGGGFVKALCFNPDLECNIPLDVTNEPLYQDPNCDGDGGEGTLLTAAFQEFSFAIPDGSTLDLKVSVHMDSGSEEVGIDWLRVEGTLTVNTVCPTVGAVSNSETSVCSNEPFNVTATGLVGMDGTTNMEQDFGIRFVAFTSAPADPYVGGTDLGTVAFGSLSGGGTTAALVGASLSTAGNYTVYAVLSPTPGDATCRPSAVSSSLVVNALPTVTMSVLGSACENDGLLLGLGGGSPNGGIYSGTGVINGGNGLTYNFDPSVGPGVYQVTYTYTDPTTGCTNSATSAPPQGLTVNANPAAPTVADITVCDGGSTLITPPAGNPPGAPAILGAEDFDGGGIGFTVSIDFNDGVNDHFSQTDGSDISNVSGIYSFDNGTNMFWAAEDTDDGGGNGLDEQTFSLNPVSIAGHGSIQFCFDLAAGNENLPGTNAYDFDDHVFVQYNTDVNATFMDGLCFHPDIDPGVDDFNEPLHHDTDCDGDGGEGPQITLTAQQFCFTIPDASTIGAGANFLNIQLLVEMDAGDEEIAFDNLEVSGVNMAGATMYKFYDANPVPGPANLLAGPATSYDPMTTPATSPQSVWVVECATPCDSEAEEVVVTVNPVPVLTETHVDASCPGAMDGSIDLTITPTGTYIIDWLDIAGSPDAEDRTGLGAGMYTVNVSDAIGCSATLTVTIGETDILPPMITCPVDITIDCEADTSPANTGMATATDVCDPAPAIGSSDVTDFSGCGGYTGTITRTWTATDASSNSTMCTQIITVQDTTAPIFTVPVDLTIQCNEDPNDLVLTGDVTDEDDNCDMGSSSPPSVWINEFHYDNISTDVGEFIEVAGTAGLDLANYSLVLYNGSNGTSYNTIALSGIIPDEGAGFGAIDFQLPTNGLQNGAPDGFALVLNGTLVIEFLSYEGPLTATNGPANGLTSTDVGQAESNNTTQIGESIQLCGTGSVASDFTWTAPSAESPGLLNACQTLVAPPPAMGLEATSFDMVVPACDGIAGVINRTWRLEDACGNFLEQVQVITIEDNDAPTFTVPADATIECSDDPNDLSVLGVPTNIMDNCDPNPMVSSNDIVDLTGCGNYTGTIMREWTVTDACGNPTIQTQTITVEDTTDPIFTVPADVTLECDQDVNDLTLTGDVTDATDNCTGATPVHVWINEIHYDNSGSDVNEFVEIAGTAGTDLSAYEVYEYNGNGGGTAGTITLSGIIPDQSNGFGTLTFLHAGLMNGSPDGLALVLNGTNVIEFLSYEGSFMATNGPANGMVSTDIGVSEPSGSSATSSLQRTGSGNTAADFSVWIGPTANTSGAINVQQTFIALPPMMGPTVAFNDVNDLTGCNGSGTIMREWTATDACNNALTLTQTITIEDTTIPDIVCPIDVTIECDESTLPANTGTATATDNCGPALDIVIDYMDASTQTTTGCGQYTYEITRTWTAADCSGTGTCMQIITVEDTTPPDVSACTADLSATHECDGAAGNEAAADAWHAANIAALESCATDLCDTDILTVNHDYDFSTLTDLCGETGVLTVNYTLEDICGNESAPLTYTFTIEDNTAPTPVCQNITVELDANGEATIVAADLDGGSSDLCGDVTLAASRTTFTCGDLAAPGSGPGCSNDVPVTLTVTDECGNSATCVAMVTVEDNLAPVLTCPADLILTLDPGECGKYLNYMLPTAIDNCESMMTTTFLGTTFIDNNGFAGNMFDIENIGSVAITINSFDIHLETALGTNHTVAAYYVTGGGTYAGNETTAGAWTLMGDVPVVAAGPGNPSPMAAGGLVIQPGETYGIYIFQTDGGSNIDYTNGANTYTDANMELRAGLGRGTPIWTGGVFNPRTWNGNVHYSVSTGVPPVVTQVSGPSLSTGDYFPIGTYTYVFQAEDGCGNISTCDFTFEILEFPNPTQSLACNQTGIQISLDPNCEAVIGADDILEGGPYGCYDHYIVDLFFDQNLTQPVPGSPLVTGANIGQTLWTMVTDPDNGNSCWGFITIEDKHIPQLECTTYEFPCVDPIIPTQGGIPGFPIPATATVLQTNAQLGSTEYTLRNFDGCGDAILSYSDWIDDIDCLVDPNNPYNKVIYRTWTAVDESGNSTQCEDTLNLIRATLADLIPPPNWNDDPAENPSLLCDEKEPTPPNNNCGNVVGWNAIDAGDYPGDDYVGHPSPLDELYPCGNVKWHGTGIPGGIDCGDVNYTFNDIRINVCQTGASEGCYKIVRNWSILDWCNGDFTTYTQFIKVADKEGPTITDIVDATISVAAWECEATYYVPEPWIMDNCSDIDGLYTVTSTAGVVTYLPSIGRYVVTELPLGIFQLKVRAVDCCGNATEVEVDITVEDLVPPYVTCEVYRTTSLTIDGTSKIWASSFDDGSYDACGPVYFKVIRMEDLLGTDHGSNSNQSSTECDGINGDDNLTRFGNQIYFDDYLKYCCEDIGVAGLQAKLRVFDRDPGAGPIDPNRMRSGGDLFGHYNDCWSNVTVEDKLAPFISCPTDITVSCDFWFDMNDLNSTFGTVRDDIADVEYILINDRWCNGDINDPNNMGSAQYDPNNPTQAYEKNVGQDGVAGDNCDVTITENVVDNLTCGQGTITRIFTATDPDGRTASCVQRITIVDCDPYYITDTNCFNFDPFDGVRWPCDYNASTCGAATDPSNAGEPQIFNDDNCALISVTYDDEEFPVVPDACFKIKRIWTITDWCTFDQFDSDNNDVYDQTDDGVIAGQWEYVQYIKVLNSTEPVFGSCDDIDICGYNTDCTANAALSNTVSDDCTPGDLLIVDMKIDLDNDGTYDILGANVQPYPYPNPNGLPIWLLSYSDADGDGTYDVTLPAYDYPVGTHRILWSAEDVCSNVGTCEYLFDAQDCAKPTPKAFHGLAVDVQPVTQQVTVTAMMMDAGSFDNCCLAANPFRIASPSGGPGQTTPPNSTEVVFGCNDLGTQSVDLWVQDCNGNWDYVISYVNVQNNMGACPVAGASISGVVENENGASLAEVNVNLTGNASSMPAPQVTSTDGVYNFSALETNMNYVVTPEKDIDYRNGISTLDIVLISRHLIGLQPLDSPYKRIAADVDNTENLSTFDIIALQKLILYIDNDFANNTSWRFVEASHTFANPNNPWSSPFPEVFDINGLSADEVANFIAVKIGDVNGNAQTSATADAGDRTFNGDLNFNVEDIAMEAGQEYTIDFKASPDASGQRLMGYQFTMNFDLNKVEIVDAVAGDLDANFGLAMVDEGVITTNWVTTEAASLSNDAVVFSVTVKANAATQLSNVVNVNSRYTVAEAYNQNLELLNVGLNFNNENGLVVSNDFDLYQNQPNPFKSETVIGFNLPEAGSATLSIYDVSGKVLRVIEGDFAKGYNEVSVTRAELAGSGVLFYQLDTETDSATRNMIVVE